MRTFAELAFTPSVQALQQRYGSRAAYARAPRATDPDEGLGPREAQHLANADSFYMATVSETGWPYVQHRGGPRGFLETISPTRIAFADFGGNGQFVSAGNATSNDRVSIIVVDYLNRRRLKLLGRLRFLTIDEAALQRASVVVLPGYRARIERIAVIDVEAFDWNCPQHITRRFTLADFEAASKPLRERIAQLEDQVAVSRRKAPMNSAEIRVGT